METYTPAREFVEDTNFDERKNEAIALLDIDDIDKPIINVISRFIRIPYCFTLQSCWGHFVHDGQIDPNSAEPLAHYDDSSSIQYRIAYIAFCIDPTDKGKHLFADLRNLAHIDPQYIQFGSADWFWKRCVNSYVLQVEPERFKLQDTAKVGAGEALHLQDIRNRFFEALGNILSVHST